MLESLKRVDAANKVILGTMSAEHGWIISDPAAGWVARHRDQGHHPYPNPTPENPERWDCDCGYIWRILTISQIGQKFAHLKSR